MIRTVAGATAAVAIAGAVFVYSQSEQTVRVDDRHVRLLRQHFEVRAEFTTSNGAGRKSFEERWFVVGSAVRPAPPDRVRAVFIGAGWTTNATGDLLSPNGHDVASALSPGRAVDIVGGGSAASDVTHERLKELLTGAPDATAVVSIGAVER